MKKKEKEEKNEVIKTESDLSCFVSTANISFFQRRKLDARFLYFCFIYLLHFPLTSWFRLRPI